MPVDPLDFAAELNTPSELGLRAGAGGRPVAKGGGTEVSKDAFLRLLTAQLQNQDPLEPVQNSEFVAELAQFQALEGQLAANATLENIAALQESQLALQGLSQAAALVGVEVSWRDEDGAPHSGVVDQVTVENGVMTAHVGDWRVPVGALTGVRRGAAAPTSPAAPATTTPSSGQGVLPVPGDAAAAAAQALQNQGRDAAKANELSTTLAALGL